jgi:hypothetical protein
VVWDTRVNRPASPSIHRQLGCAPDPAIPLPVAVNDVTPDMGIFTVDKQQLAELFRLASDRGHRGTSSVRRAGPSLSAS